MKELYEQFLFLIRIGIGHSFDTIPKTINWQGVKDLSDRHGLLAVLLDGIEQLPENMRPPQELLLEWIGEVLQSFEFRYDTYKHSIAEMASFYHSHDIKMMVVKGFACSLDWPKPEHRPCGDIDIWQFGEYKKADALIAKEKNIGIDRSKHHHTVFYWGDFMVENHYDFVNVHHTKSNADLEVIFKKLGNVSNLSENGNHVSVGNHIPSVDICGERVYLPSPNLHALFLIRHLVSHFASSEISLRQVLDWAFFVEKHNRDINWEWLLELIVKYHMMDFFNCINAICVEDLGFDFTNYPEVRYLPELKERILADILSPAFPAAEPCGLLKRVAYKYERWRGNAWKQELCYAESRWSAFWSGIWNHILKPSSI